jgi:arylsulfatase A-like enzyme
VRVDGGASGLRDLRCEAEVSDAETLRFRWTLDGADTPFDAEVVPVAEIASGQVWACAVTAESEVGTDSGEAAPFVVREPPGGNVLVIVVDDLGIDNVGLYGTETPAPPTPVLDGLAAQGVRFQNVWVTPACATSRGVLLSGRHGRRTGLVQSISDGQVLFALDPREVLLPELLDDNRAGFAYRSAALGKWHLMSVALFEAGSVEAEGFGSFQGTKSNLGPTWDYFSWQQVWTDQSVSMRDGYITSAVVDDAERAIAAMPEPWLTWVALHAAHDPMHVPPAELQDRGVTEDSGDPALFDAVVQAADTEIGRLLASIDPGVLARTTVVVIGDNGTPEFAVDPPLDPLRAKNTVFEGGLRVPLIVTGPLVTAPGATSEALVHGVDLFATVADIAGVPLTGFGDATSVLRADGTTFPIDGVSFLPSLSDPAGPGGRAFLFTEQAHPNGPPPWEDAQTTVRNQDYKLIYTDDRGYLLYRLGDGLDEGENLLVDGATPDEEALAAFEALKAEIERVHTNTPYAW